ncbi:capsular polysaccharide biosynthesis protein [Shewanella sp. A25]|nr:capsular polysaccharide biosynthesis protein [Shewanella shenzhenensis]
MTFYTHSTGILARRTLLESCLNSKLTRYSRLQKYTSEDIFVGWGNKPSSEKLAIKAKELNLEYLRLEDGFIGYVGHPANGGQSVSVVIDKFGIYYDSSKLSTLEYLIPEQLTAEEEVRSRQLLKSIKQLGITKYNHYRDPTAHFNLPDTLEALLAGAPYVLLVDQVAGDLSLQGTDNHVDALDMLAKAKEHYPNARLVIRSHPDTQFGKKQGLFAALKHLPELKDVIWFNQPCHPHGLIRSAEAVFTISSQMGFEALLLDKPVYCFGLPFYAGWGLTQDTKTCLRRQELLHHTEGKVSLLQLLHAALIKYPRYYHPILNRRCEVEDILPLIVAQQRGEHRWNRLYMLGFSRWKRAFMVDFCKHLAKDLQFVSKPPAKLNKDEKLLVWGNRFSHMHQVIRVEDGFIRSSGLGSNLCRPSSLVIDTQGMYFNAQRKNNLRHLLNTLQLTQEEIARGYRLCDSLVSADINKYNLASHGPYQPPATDKLRLLVVGQVDGDASTVTGSAVIQNNEQLLLAVREAFPDAWIVYKPHPDVVAGNREGRVSEHCMQNCVDEYLTNITLNELYPNIDAMHTMTSLSGFEALIRGVKVVTWGQPFYAGWGLTHDMHPANDRLCQRSLAELVYITLVTYPIYIDWDTGLHSTPEWMIEKFATRKADASLQVSRLRRWRLKWSYLMEALNK